MASRLNQHLLCGSPPFLVLFVSFSVVVSVYLIAYLPCRAGAISFQQNTHTVPVTLHSRHPHSKVQEGLRAGAAPDSKRQKGKLKYLFSLTFFWSCSNTVYEPYHLYESPTGLNVCVCCMSNLFLFFSFVSFRSRVLSLCFLAKDKRLNKSRISSAAGKIKRLPGTVCVCRGELDGMK
jgi:hypothetical protein